MMTMRMLLVLALLRAGGAFTGWVDPDTAQSKRTLRSMTDGQLYELVMSDEFEREGRTFDDGDDPMWTGITRPDDDQTAEGKKSLQYYNASQISTKGGALIIKTTTEETHWRGFHPYLNKYVTMKRHFKSGMLQGWNKFCFTGGIVEVDVQFPGEHDIGGLWPAVWMLGNLGRAAFEASTNKLWPWSFDECDRKLQHAQELSACAVTDHYSLHPMQGRGATEMDLIEVMPGPPGALPIVKNGVGRPYSAMTLQLAPGIPAKDNRPPSGVLPEWGFTWYENLTFGANTSINPFFYGTYLATTKKEEPIGRSAKEAYQCDAIGAMMAINQSFWRGMHTFRMEWQPGDTGYIHWYVDNEFRFGIEAQGLQKYKTRIPEEPSYLILNTAISTSWGFPAPPLGCDEYDCKSAEGRCGFNAGFCDSLPAEFKVGHVRVYQNKKDPKMHLGCNPKSHPTRRFIAAHPERYMLATDLQPLKAVSKGGGACKSDKDCGETSGSCGVLRRCQCSSDWTGPRCLVPAYRNDFPDWDRQSWAYFVAPCAPPFLLAAAALFLLLLAATVCWGARQRAQAKRAQGRC